jgi:hypothetical protein
MTSLVGKVKVVVVLFKVYFRPLKISCVMTARTLICLVDMILICLLKPQGKPDWVPVEETVYTFYLFS